MSETFRTALVTGASSGIGRALSLHYATRGARVFAAARRVDRLRDLSEEARAAGGDIVPVAMDVADASATMDRIRRLDDEAGGLDLVIANAGIHEETPCKAFEWSKFEQTIDVNVTGACATLYALVPRMMERRRGHLVGISSAVAGVGIPAVSAYAASKAFLDTVLQAMRAELAPFGVHVTTIQPGFVESELNVRPDMKRPFLMETNEAVRHIAAAIDRGAGIRSFPWQLKAGFTLMRMLPESLFSMAARRAP